jgi:glycine cleavage system transcriptional repressor
MPHFMVAAAGPDQPGIVAELTRVFVERDCNLEDSSMTVLRGHFAMMLTVEVAPGTQAQELESDLRFATTQFGLIVNVWEINDLVGFISDMVNKESPGERWTVSISGADRRGIVHGIAKILADHDANIVQVSTRLGGEHYTMDLGVTVWSHVDADVLQKDLSDGAKKLGVELDVRRPG